MNNGNEEYYNLINQAFQMFNDQMNTDYSFDNVDVMLTEAKNADRDIAEFLARLVDLNMPDYSLRGNTKYINGLLEEIAGSAPFVKTKITNLLVDVMTAKEVLGAPDKETAFGKLAKFKRLQTVSWIKLLNTVYDQLFDDKRDFWEIDFEFIESLGNNYLALTTEIVLGLMGDSRDMAVANKIMGRMVAGIE